MHASYSSNGIEGMGLHLRCFVRNECDIPSWHMRATKQWKDKNNGPQTVRVTSGAGDGCCALQLLCCMVAMISMLMMPLPRTTLASQKRSPFQFAIGCLTQDDASRPPPLPILCESSYRDRPQQHTSNIKYQAQCTSSDRAVQGPEPKGIWYCEKLKYDGREYGANKCGANFYFQS
jgi:hypothetical protein